MRSVFRQPQIRLVRPALRRYFADQKHEKHPKKPVSSSLLSDDLLEKAGMDTRQEMERDTRAQSNNTTQSQDSAASSSENASSESAADSAESASASDSDSASDSSAAHPQKKWEPNARRISDKSSTVKKREKRSNMFYAIMLGTAIGGTAYLARDWDDESERERHKDIDNGYSPIACYQRAVARFGDFFNYFSEPLSEKLLPDPLPAPYGRPVTLVLGLDDLLVHSEWTREHGWRTAKRPGLDYFLGYLSQYFEIVIFTSTYQAYAEKLVTKLDPYRATISYSLFREASRYKDGKVVKDLSALNRDLGHVIMVDTTPDSWMLQPDNAIKLKPWTGNADDKGLVELIPFFEWLASQQVKDVRPIIKTFDGCDDIGAEYARREAIVRKEFEDQWRKEHSGSNWASSFLGIKPMTSSSPMMPLDYFRQESQKSYQEFQKYIAENGAKMLAEEKAREQQILGDQKFTLGKLVTEGLPNPEELAAAHAEREQRERETLQSVMTEEQQGIEAIRNRS